ncbi:MAG: nucleotide exchange factor GrpE [Armatimonadota bacterium]
MILASGLLVWNANAAVPVTVVIVVAALGLFLWWQLRLLEMRLAAPPQAEEPLPAVEDEPEEPAVETNEGPGQLLVRFQSLHKEFDQATKELQRYNGSREVQLQGWQQLSSDIIRRILPVLDNLEPYLDDTDSTASDVAQLAYGRLLTELVTIGVTQIIPSPGEPFDGKYHLLGPDSVGYPPYRIKTVMLPGYRFQPRIPGASEIVLKPAEVIVETDIEHPDAEPVKDEPQSEMTELERVAAAMSLDGDDDAIEIRRMPLPEDDDDEDDGKIKRMPTSLADDY